MRKCQDAASRPGGFSTCRQHSPGKAKTISLLNDELWNGLFLVVPSQPRRLSKSKRQGWQFPKIEFSKKTQKSLVGSQENRTFALAKTK